MVGDELRGDNGFGYVDNVAFSADGKRLATQDMDGTVRFWDVDSGDCLHESVWTRGDVGQSSVLSLEECASSGNGQEKSRVRLEGVPTAYGSAGGSLALAALEDSASWEYAEVSRIIVARSGNEVYFFGTRVNCFVNDLSCVPRSCAFFFPTKAILTLPFPFP